VGISCISRFGVGAHQCTLILGLVVLALLLRARLPLADGPAGGAPRPLWAALAGGRGAGSRATASSRCGSTSRCSSVLLVAADPAAW
jgi:hypothetical protein